VDVALGACGCDTRHTLPSGEHSQGVYSVSTIDTTVLSIAVSTRTVRPSPSVTVFTRWLPVTAVTARLA
jgi:hypothetical protein